MVVKIKNIRLLLDDVNDKIKREPLIGYTLDEMLAIMKLDPAIKEYINIENFITDMGKQKLLEWEKLCIFANDNKVWFFKYVRKC